MTNIPTGGRTGGCQCGHIRYQIEGDIQRLNVCHCLDCQKQSGSAFGMSLIVKEDAFRLTSGKLKKFETGTASKRTKTCAFCPECGVRIYNMTVTLMAIKPGTLDDTSWLKPDAHYWTKRKQEWTPLPDDIPCYEEVS